MSNAKYKFSEVFRSIQGEGHYTGVPTAWVRWFLCNLECRGFSQPNPADPSTYHPVGNEYDLSSITDITQLPVFKYGCDSAYSVAKRYRQLYPECSAEQIADQLEKLITNQFNPNGQFCHPHSHTATHLCFTGGEPMLKRNQQGTVDVIRELERRGNFPKYVTIETNGTQVPTQPLIELIEERYTMTRMEWFWSVSPKLLHTSGESAKRAINPQLVAEYQRISSAGQLKFVVSNSAQAWEELEQRVSEFRKAGVQWPIWIMPVGATVEDQSDHNTRAVVEETIRRGYNVSGRLHAYIWGNTVGV